MAAMTHRNQSLVAAGGVAPAGARWSAADANSVVRNRHHLTVIAAMPATYEVKPSFASGTTRGIAQAISTATTRRLTEGSS